GGKSHINSGYHSIKDFLAKWGLTLNIKGGDEVDAVDPEDNGQLKALFVVGHHRLNSSDRAIKRHLESKGFKVSVKKDKYARTRDAHDKDLIFISETAHSKRVNIKSLDKDVPIICSEPRLFDDLGMTGPHHGIDYGHARREKYIHMVDDGDFLPESFTQDKDVKVSYKKSKMGWGVPGNGAIRVATLPRSEEKCTIFAYNRNVVAPAKRIAYFLYGSAAKLQTPAGWELFNAVVDWAVAPDGVDTAGPTVEISADPVFITAGEVASLNWTITDGEYACIDQGVGEVSIQSTTEVEPAVTTTYTIMVSGPGGTANAQATVAVEDFFTFSQSSSELDYQMFTFTPDGSPNFYRLCRDTATEFPTDPAGGTILALGDDDSKLVDLQPYGVQVSLYGVDYDQFYVGSNGYLTFTEGKTDYTESYVNHFNTPRISAVFDDMNPTESVDTTISWKQLEDRVAVTVEGLLEYGAQDTNNWQVEMFFDGKIRITYLNIGARDGLAGLSDGNGLPTNFNESDPLAYGTCISPCNGDFNEDGAVDDSDRALFDADYGRSDCSEGEPCMGDFDLDGDVDVSDWLLFDVSYGRTDCPMI
ncbi:MAG: hypothetical protein JSV31_28780, partial [Desulfobacterales bacterium]